MHDKTSTIDAIHDAYRADVDAIDAKYDAQLLDDPFSWDDFWSEPKPATLHNRRVEAARRFALNLRWIKMHRACVAARSAIGCGA